MAHGNDPVVAPATPSIGATIDDEGPSRAKTFFSNPKNLATMLVLASAIAQPKQRGQSNLAHALRGGVGALGFRGGLDDQIHQQQQLDAEQASVANARVEAATSDAQRARAATAGVVAQREATTQRGASSAAETAQRAASSAAQTAATVGATAQRGASSAAEITSAEAINQAQIDAGRFDPNTPAGGTFLERSMLQAEKSYTDAYTAWVGFGSQGPPPQRQDFILAALQSAAVLGQSPPGMDLQFEPTAVPEDTDDEATIIPGVGVGEPGGPAGPTLDRQGASQVSQLARTATPQQRQRAADADQRAGAKEGRSFAVQKVLKGEITDEVEARLLKKKYPPFKDLASDAEVIQAARATDQVLLDAVDRGETDFKVMADLWKRMAAATPGAREIFKEYAENIRKERNREATRLTGAF